MLCLISLLIILALGTGPAAEKMAVDDFRVFFTDYYHPTVEYDENGRVLKGGCPLTAGHIKPDWENAKSSTEGRGKNRKTVCSVPITVEREIYTALEDAGPESVREMAGRELIITCRENEEGDVWAAAIRYRITDPCTHKDGKFTGLEIDVDPNTFAIISVKEYKRDKLVLNEESLEGYRWTYEKIGSLPVITQCFVFPYQTPPSFYRAGESFSPRDYSTKGDPEGPYVGTVQVRGNHHTRLDYYASTYRRIIDIPEIRSAITKYLYYPVTVK